MEPEPISIIQALEDLSHNRLVWSLRRRRVWIPVLVLSIGSIIALGIFAPTYVIVPFVAIPGAVFVSLILYLVSHWRFVSIIRTRRPLCPSCKSLVWQVRCSQCDKPVPLLALLLKGALLAHCPHCGRSLSPKDRTLVGWCHSCWGRDSNCSVSIPRPDIHFFLRTAVEIELGISVPQQTPEGWKIKANSAFMELHQSRNGTYTIRYCVTHNPASFQSIPYEMYIYVREIWIRHGVNPRVWENVLGAVPIITRSRTELLFEDSEVADLKAIKMRGFCKIYTDIPRPIQPGIDLSSPNSPNQKKTSTTKG